MMRLLLLFTPSLLSTEVEEYVMFFNVILNGTNEIQPELKNHQVGKHQQHQ
jgi:hypothetical protein